MLKPRRTRRNRRWPTDSSNGSSTICVKPKTSVLTHRIPKNPQQIISVLTHRFHKHPQTIISVLTHRFDNHPQTPISVLAHRFHKILNPFFAYKNQPGGAVLLLWLERGAEQSMEVPCPRARRAHVHREHRCPEAGSRSSHRSMARW